jgi:hypothetical protein
VRRLLGWTTPELSRKIRAGLSSLSDLVAGEFVLFNAYITCGLAPPISSFFLLLLEEFGLQLQHLTPHSVLLMASSPTSWRCSWGCGPASPSLGISTPWSGQVGASAKSTPTTSSFGTGCPAPTSPPSPAPSGRNGATTGSSPWLTPTTASSFRRKGPSLTAAARRPGCPYRQNSTQCWTGSKL